MSERKSLCVFPAESQRLLKSNQNTLDNNIAQMIAKRREQELREQETREQEKREQERLNLKMLAGMYIQQLVNRIPSMYHSCARLLSPRTKGLTTVVGWV
jgi:hypothetical protein